MPSEAEAVHGLTDVFLSDKPRFAEQRRASCSISSRIRRWSRTMPRFDFGFLNFELEQCGRPAGLHAAGWSTR